ncbi:MAG TPA: 3-oxoacyl-[acyl-carrier-protein] reductase [Kiritimatiellia bacterium]|jgi:3-oxoacyl-[acyl-carrier protein] reductase|nr:3-oxoacyl-[acyl-carrier-protein] reductase [Kiritimatiellia bacterium]NLC82260.1 3-oxoacyl-[acyl-carrier-protein] reductase [Lentisphaerota bacterium]MDD4173077.1 3-oxoacyl-[acyl-carrier-protein] reductase [Kiritimatiellia bacterium]MDD4442149.1 3-oxoacyl-[acyl-carrier-protein] reductase [Kiritimatiellia bacterium]MDX9792834.1 3-oxoacyl-[acyl-carrier-protein] reductase [Kiritimatiellia bacterium]
MAAFEGKVAVVTGAARGIGQAIAQRLAQEGADVVICDLQAEWLAETAGIVEGLGRKALPLAVDVGDSEAVNACINEVVKVFGKVDIMVNNAGITKDTLLVRMSDDDWDAVLRVNLKGTFLFSRAVAKHMMKQRSGAIVNIASISGVIGTAGQANYAASKAGVIALTKSTANELAARGVRANAIAPGFISSKMTDALSEDVRKQYLSRIPLGRFGTVEDIANAVVFLASEQSSYMTGQTLHVNGGMVM